VAVSASGCRLTVVERPKILDRGCVAGFVLEPALEAATSLVRFAQSRIDNPEVRPGRTVVTIKSYSAPKLVLCSAEPIRGQQVGSVVEPDTSNARTGFDRQLEHRFGAVRISRIRKPHSQVVDVVGEQRFRGHDRRGDSLRSESPSQLGHGLRGSALEQFEYSFGGPRRSHDDVFGKDDRLHRHVHPIGECERDSGEGSAIAAMQVEHRGHSRRLGLPGFRDRGNLFGCEDGRDHALTAIVVGDSGRAAPLRFMGQRVEGDACSVDPGGVNEPSIHGQELVQQRRLRYRVGECRWMDRAAECGQQSKSEQVLSDTRAERGTDANQ